MRLRNNRCVCRGVPAGWADGLALLLRSIARNIAANNCHPASPTPQFLENVLHAPPALAELRTVDEAVVIGAALSLSSSAFVLQVWVGHGAEGVF